MHTVYKILLISLLLGTFPTFSFAQDPPPNEEFCPNPGPFGCFEVGLPGVGTKSIDSFLDSPTPVIKFTNLAVNVVIAALVLIGVITVVIGGYLYMTAGGNASQVGTAKEMILAALVGIFLALISVVILNTINRFLGSEAQEPELGSTSTGITPGGESGGGTGGGGTGTGGGTGNSTGPGNAGGQGGGNNAGQNSGGGVGSLPVSNSIANIPSVVNGGIPALQQFSRNSNDLVVSDRQIIFRGQTYNPEDTASLGSLVTHMQNSGIRVDQLRAGPVEQGMTLRIVRDQTARVSAWQSLQSFLVTPINDGGVGINAQNIILSRDLIQLNP